MGKQRGEVIFSAYVLIDHPKGSGRFVLVEETSAHKRGKFNLPGGKEDPGDPNLLSTAGRETKEETGGDNANPDDGLEVEIDGLVNVYPHDRKPNGRIVVFSGFVIAGAMSPTSEHPTVDAYPREEVVDLLAEDRLRHPRVLHAIDTYLGDLAIPISSLAPQQVREAAVVDPSQFLR
jgi:ADP-ribose pyrophosphatase YjhB (NUDIX family)